MWKVIVPVVLAALFSVGSAGMAGAPVEVNINEDEGAQSALKFAVVEHNRQSNGLFLTKPAEVLSVKKQLVAGYLYVITVRMGKTPCRKNNASDSCVIHEDLEKAQPYQCVFKVWSRPWLNETVLKDESCL